MVKPNLITSSTKYQHNFKLGIVPNQVKTIGKTDGNLIMDNQRKKDESIFMKP